MMIKIGQRQGAEWFNGTIHSKSIFTSDSHPTENVAPTIEAMTFLTNLFYSHFGRYFGSLPVLEIIFFTHR